MNPTVQRSLRDAHITTAGDVRALTSKDYGFPDLLGEIDLLSEVQDNVSMLWMAVLNYTGKFIKSWNDFAGSELPNLYLAMNRTTGIIPLDTDEITTANGDGHKLLKADLEVMSDQSMNHFFSLVNNWPVRHHEFLTQLNALLSNVYDNAVAIEIPPEYVPPNQLLYNLLDALTAVDVSNNMISFMNMQSILIFKEDFLTSNAEVTIAKDDFESAWVDYWSRSGSDPLTVAQLESVYNDSHPYPGSIFTVTKYQAEFTGYTYCFVPHNFYFANVSPYPNFYSNLHLHLTLPEGMGTDIHDFLANALKIYAGHKLGLFEAGGSAPTLTTDVPLWVLNRMKPTFTLLKRLIDQGVSTCLSNEAIATMTAMIV
jgi:hypothetical protein